MAQGDRLNFRCSAALKKRLAEAAAKSQVSVSEQARISLERLYQVKEEERVWLPEILRERPGSKRPSQRNKDKALVG